MATENAVQRWWPILVTLGASMVAFGSLRADVTNIQEEQAKLATDHDMIVRTDERVGRMERDVKEIKEDIKDIAESLREPSK